MRTSSIQYFSCCSLKIIERWFLQIKFAPGQDFDLFCCSFRFLNNNFIRRLVKSISFETESIKKLRQSFCDINGNRITFLSNNRGNWRDREEVADRHNGKQNSPATGLDWMNGIKLRLDNPTNDIQKLSNQGHKAVRTIKRQLIDNYEKLVKYSERVNGVEMDSQLEAGAHFLHQKALTILIHLQDGVSNVIK